MVKCQNLTIKLTKLIHVQLVRLGHYNIVKVLLQNNARKEIRNNKGKSPLDLASKTGNEILQHESRTHK